MVFSAKHSFADMRECNLKENQNLTKIGPECKKVFFVICLVLVVLSFFSLCFCAFALHKLAQNCYFPAFSEGFCPFVPTKGLS